MVVEELRRLHLGREGALVSLFVRAWGSNQPQEFNALLRGMQRSWMISESSGFPDARHSAWLCELVVSRLGRSCGRSNSSSTA